MELFVVVSMELPGFSVHPSLAHYQLCDLEWVVLPL